MITTAWVIQGIGHGHVNVVTAAKVAAGVQARVNAAVVQYQRITEVIIESLHCHGAQDDFSGLCGHRGAQ